MKSKRLLSLAAAVVMIATLIPQMAGPLYAADGEAAIVTGTDSLQDDEAAIVEDGDEPALTLPEEIPADEGKADEKQEELLAEEGKANEEDKEDNMDEEPQESLPEEVNEEPEESDSEKETDVPAKVSTENETGENPATAPEEEEKTIPAAQASDTDTAEDKNANEETPSLHNVKVYDPEPAEPSSVSPGSINEATSKFVDALKKFTSDTSEMDKIPAILERFGGVTSAISGGIIVLQMCGLLKDSTSEALNNILSEVHSVEDQLHTMDVKLDEIIQMLTKIELELKEKDLSDKTIAYQNRWTEFNTNYVEPLKDYVSDYSGYINRALGAWWDEGTHKGERVLYTEYQGEIVVTYATGAYEDGFPSVSANGETVLVDYSFGIPADIMFKTTPGKFTPDTFEEDFIMLAADTILNAANERKLDATDAFYQAWDDLDEIGKTAASAMYAHDLMNTVVNRISCEAMTQNDAWVNNFKNAYINYCSNMTNPTTGASAMVKLFCLTNPMELWASARYENFCEQMIAASGSYGTFLLSVMGQDAYQGKSSKEQVQKAWADTILAIDKIKTDTSTGYGNYCYLTNSLITIKIWNINSTMTANYTQWKTGKKSMDVRYDSFSSTPWKLLDEDGNDASKTPIVNGVDAILIYQQFQNYSSPGDIRTYLAMAGCGDYYWMGKPEWFMTEYGGGQDFSLSACPELECDSLYDHQDYFSTGKTYQINKGNHAGVKNDCFVLHDHVSASFISLVTGETQTDPYAAARASYREHDKWWNVDEGHIFFRNVDSTHKTHADSKQYHVTKDFTLNRTVYVLEETPIPKESIAEDSLLNEIIEICVTNRQHDPRPEPYSSADWNAFHADIVDTYAETDSKLDSGIDAGIEEAVESAAASGVEIALSESEKATLASAIRKQIFDLQSEMQTNGALEYRDVFGINGNEAAELQLAAAVLPPGCLDENGASKITAENMDTRAVYEADVQVSFKSENGGITAVLNPSFSVEPELIIWNPVLEEFVTYEIPDEVMTAQGLAMNVRLSAVSAGESASVTIRHYDNDLDMNLLEQTDAAVQGSGTDRFAEISVSHCSPFELVLNNTVVLREPKETPTVVPTSTPTRTPGKTNVTAAKTGDPNAMRTWLVLIMISALGMGTALFARKRYKSEGRN